GQGSASKWPLAMMNLPNIQHGLWIVFLLVAATSISIFLFLSRRAGIGILLLIPALSVIDGIRFDSRFIKLYDYKQQVTPNPLTNYLTSLPGKFRVFNITNLPQDYLPFYGIEVVAGYHGNQLRWYDDLIGGPGLVNQGNPQFLNLVGARYILASSGTKIPPDYFGPDTLVLAQDFGSLAVFENKNALPRAFLVNKYEVVPIRRDIYPRLLSSRTNLKEMVFLEEEPNLNITSNDSLSRPVDMISYSGDSVVIGVHNASNCLLILTDNYYRSWEAWVDGVKAPILRADGAFRAVPLKAGASRVIFRYNRSLNNLALVITLLTVFLVMIILAIYFFLYLKEKNG
ncbi:MAG: hypothetical protein NTV06_03045, partial [candidate division Zixibacteria bacterium]|nr:hypothetical protein [candidate division Zixibacteria bacterium]